MKKSGGKFIKRHACSFVYRLKYFTLFHNNLHYMVSFSLPCPPSLPLSLSLLLSPLSSFLSPPVSLTHSLPPISLSLLSLSLSLSLSLPLSLPPSPLSDPMRDSVSSSGGSETDGMDGTTPTSSMAGDEDLVDYSNLTSDVTIEKNFKLAIDNYSKVLYMYSSDCGLIVQWIRCVCLFCYRSRQVYWTHLHV